MAVAGLVLWAAHQPAFAGGIIIKPESLEMASGTVRPGELVTISFDAVDYEFGSDNYKYLLFALAPTEKVRRSVAISYSPKKVMAMRTFDRALAPQAYYRLLASSRTGRRQAAVDSSDGPSRFTLRFPAPTKPGTYELQYSRLPVFRPNREAATDAPGEMVKIESGSSKLGEVAAFGPQAGFASSVVTFVVSSAPVAPKITLYLRANGKQPAFADIKGGLVDRPLTFSWNIGPETKLPADKFVYRYKIWPVDSDFSAWTHDTSVNYRFLPKGAVKFTVQARFDDGHVVTNSAPAYANFVLDEHLVANVTPGRSLKGPTKGFTDDGKDLPPTVAFENLYPHSRALIVGIHRFDDHRDFTDFGADKIQKDVDTLQKALKANGFTVTKVIADRLTRDQIMAAVENLVSETKPDDRLFIYFSTHGFPDPMQQTAGWLATSNCDMMTPTVHCIGLKDLEYQAQRALMAKAKQVLIAVDSCFSGLGVISKAVSPPNFTMLAARPGAFMLTAGMADQKAEIDPGLGMSTFTYYLSQGLSGEAAIFDANGVITLSQLYAYVQYKVTEKSGSRQTPMLGRLTGDGEMLFKPKANP